MEKDIYARYTGLFNKENELIKNRLNWLFGTQTLLFGVLKIAFSKAPDSFKELQLALQYAIVHVGFLSSILYLVSILAAVVTYLKFHFTKPEVEESQKKNYPEFNRWFLVIILGFVAALGMPIIFIWAWHLQFQFVELPN